MAGAGIGICAGCGRDNQPLVSDLCPDCHMKEFHDSLEAAPLKTGATVWQLKGGYKDFSQKWIVVEDFRGNWSDYVHCRRSDGTGAIHLHERKTITSQ